MANNPTKPKFVQLENMTQAIEDALTNASAPASGTPFLTGSSDVQAAVDGANSPAAGKPFLTGSTDVQASLDNANAPSAGNPLQTQSDVDSATSGNLSYLGSSVVPADTAFGSAVSIPADTKVIKIRAMVAEGNVADPGHATIDADAAVIRGFHLSSGVQAYSTGTIVGQVIATNPDADPDTIDIDAYSGPGGSITFGLNGTGSSGAVLVDFYG